MKKRSSTKLREAFDTIAGLFGFVIFFIVGIAFIVFFLKGATFFSEKLLPVLYVINGWLFSLLILIALPLSIVKKFRGMTALLFQVSSYFFGLTTWLVGFSLTYLLWGMFWVFVGLFIFGVGVVPFGLIASAFNQEWAYFATLLILVIITYSFRLFASWLIVKHDEYLEEKDVIDINEADVTTHKETNIPLKPSIQDDKLGNWDDIKDKED